MEINQYTNLTKKKPIKIRPLPKATQKYLEADETLFWELEEPSICYECKFQPIHTKKLAF